jgi:ABC-type branched-subunit amino acid transport system permease subunit
VRLDRAQALHVLLVAVAGVLAAAMVEALGAGDVRVALQSAVLLATAVGGMLANKRRHDRSRPARRVDG